MPLNTGDDLKELADLVPVIPHASERENVNETEAEGDSGASAIGGDRDGRRNCRIPPAGADADSGHAPS